MPWNSASALPNCLRSLTYAVAAASAPLRDADHLRADADAALVQRLDRDLVALADRAEHVLVGHLAVIEE